MPHVSLIFIRLPHFQTWFAYCNHISVARSSKRCNPWPPSARSQRWPPPPPRTSTLSYGQTCLAIYTGTNAVVVRHEPNTKKFKIRKSCFLYADFLRFSNRISTIFCSQICLGIYKRLWFDAHAQISRIFFPTLIASVFQNATNPTNQHRRLSTPCRSHDVTCFFLLHPWSKTKTPKKWAAIFLDPSEHLCTDSSFF